MTGVEEPQTKQQQEKSHENMQMHALFSFFLFFLFFNQRVRGNASSAPLELRAAKSRRLWI